MFAPNAAQMHVVNHCEGKPTQDKRNILEESARIARGDVTDLAKLDVSAFDAAIIPGEAGKGRDHKGRIASRGLRFPLLFLCFFFNLSV